MADEEEAEAPPREYTTTPEQLIHACRTAPFVDACELVLSTDLAALAPSGETPLLGGAGLVWHGGSLQQRRSACAYARI